MTASNKLLAISRPSKVLLTLGITMVAASYVMTPVIVRSLVDGFLPTRDITAIQIGISVLVALELAAVLSSYTIGKILDDLTHGFILKTKNCILDRLTNAYNSLDAANFQRFWAQDINRLANHLIRYRWQRYRDTVLIILLTLVSVSISYKAGIVVASIILVEVLLHFWKSQKSTHSIGQLKQREHEESLFVVDWINKLNRSIDTGQAGHENQHFKSMIQGSSEAAYSTSRFYTSLNETQRLVRVLGILGVLFVASLEFNNPDWSSGALWALLIVIFRLIRPIESMAHWVFTERQFSFLEARWRNLIDNPIPFFDDKPDIFPAIKKVCDKVINSDKGIQIISSSR